MTKTVKALRKTKKCLMQRAYTKPVWGNLRDLTIANSALFVQNFAKRCQSSLEMSPLLYCKRIVLKSDIGDHLNYYCLYQLLSCQNFKLRAIKQFSYVFSIIELLSCLWFFNDFGISFNLVSKNAFISSLVGSSNLYLEMNN